MKTYINTLLSPKKYLDASVCAKTFYEIAHEWLRCYEAFEMQCYKDFCLDEYHKWKKYAEIFNKE